MMGHGLKNTNRGEAIAKNTLRVRNLESNTNEKLADMTKRLRALTEIIEEMSDFVDQAKKVMVSFGVRLDLVERPWWEKAWDWVAGGWRFVVTKRVGFVDGVTVEEVDEPEEGVVVIDSLPRDDAPIEEQDDDDETPVDGVPGAGGL